MKKIYQVLFFLVLSTWAIIAAADTSYIIYIDAGSTDTRLHIYKYIYDPSKIPEITNIHTVSAKDLKNTSPALSSFAGKSDKKVGEDLLKGLLDDAEEFLKAASLETEPELQSGSQKNINIFLLGTAGMRLLPALLRDPTYNAAKEYVKTRCDKQDLSLHPGFKFETQEKNNFENLEPKLEALYGWLDVNYLAGKFEKQDTMGSIDMGGASLEIAYATDTEIKGDDKNMGFYNLHIGQNDYKVIAASIPGLGHEESRKSILDMSNRNFCFPAGMYNVKIVDKSAQIQSSGFDLGICKTVYDEFLSKNAVLAMTTISDNLKGKIIQFMAYSGIYKAWQAIDSAVVAPEQEVFNKKITDACAAPRSSTAAQSYCPNATYISEILFNKLNLNKRVLISNIMLYGNSKQHIDWPLGAVLYGLIIL